MGRGHDRQFLPLEVDLTNAQAIEQSLAQAHQHFGALDVVVNNAGYALGGSAEELSLDEMRQSLEINLLATIAVTHSALPYLRAQRSGHILNISSTAGFLVRPGFSLYHTAKFAVVGFTESLAQDVAELGIKATVVLPSGLRTKFLSGDSVWRRQGREQRGRVQNLVGGLCREWPGGGNRWRPPRGAGFRAAGAAWVPRYHRAVGGAQGVPRLLARAGPSGAGRAPCRAGDPSAHPARGPEADTRKTTEITQTGAWPGGRYEKRYGKYANRRRRVALGGGLP